jgi:hypothetical protein
MKIPAEVRHPGHPHDQSHRRLGSSSASTEYDHLASYADDHLDHCMSCIGQRCAPRHERALGRSHRASGLRTATLPQRQKTGLAHRRNINAQVRDLARVWWRYSPLTRTRRKPLTCDFATPRLSQPLCAPRPNTKRPGSLRDHLDERDITDLITAHREGTTAVSLSAAHDLSLTSVKCLLHIAGVAGRHPLDDLPRQRQWWW